MKKSILFFVLTLFWMTGQAQIAVKGIKLGTYYYGADVIQTTLGNIKGVLAIEQLNDKRIFAIVFFPSKNGYVEKVDFYDFNKLKLGIENHYGIIFKKIMDKVNSNNYKLIAKKNGVTYSCLVEISIKEYKPYKIGFSFINQKLLKIKMQIEQRKTNVDF